MSEFEPNEFESDADFEPAAPEHDLVGDATTYVRENPVPTLTGVLVVGFVIALLSWALHRPKSRTERLQELLEDTVHELTDLVGPLKKRAGRAYADSSEAVTGALSDVVDRAKDLDAEPYLKSFRKWWKSCCG